MKASDLERLVASVQTGRVKTDAEQRMRELRKLGFIPTGGRGPNAPDIGPEHCATFIIAVGGSTNASQAGRAVLQFAGLEPAEEIWGETLRDVLVKAFEDLAVAARIKKLHFFHDEHSASMIWRNDDGELQNTVFLPSREDREEWAPDNEICRGIIGDETYISGKLIHEIAAELKRPPGARIAMGSPDYVAAAAASGRGGHTREEWEALFASFKAAQQVDRSQFRKRKSTRRAAPKRGKKT